MSFNWLDKIKSKNKEESSWELIMGDRFTTLTCLGGIFLLALFIRTFFAFDLATKFGTPYLLSGGSDAYYYERIINYIHVNHQHMWTDPLRKFPIGGSNTRPPFFAWSVMLGGYMVTPLVGNVNQAISYSFILSTGLWGALTIFPTYLVGRDTFGKKAGIGAAFLLAVSSGHLQRSTITNGDHDAIYLFFGVTAFYFFMKALECIPEREIWVSEWSDWDEIKSGLARFTSKNKRALLYSAMSGMAIAAVSLAWKGYAYLLVILVIYILLQLFIDKFRGLDSLGITVCFGITLAVVFLLAGPWYISWRPFILTDWSFMGLERYYQTPLVMSLGIFGLGVFFTVTRKYPWLLILSIIAGTGVLFFAFARGMVQSAASQYFIQNKLYSTIAEAQAPMFSKLVLSFGVLTFFLSMVGIALAVWHLIRGDWRKPFIFILVWTVFAIYMAISAARFLFNASPAFALTAGWVIAYMVDKADFGILYRKFVSHRGSPISAFKEGIKIKHILVTLVVIFLIFVPNVLYAFDGGIPYQEKKDYDDQIYKSLPKAMRPEGHNTSQGSTWYLGAFGYSMDKPTGYWPAAWSWFKKQDADMAPEERPAFASWWDYGFECVQEGKHPTVADNFQQGYEVAGNILMSQNESEVLALFIGRELEAAYDKDKGRFDEDAREILVEHIGEEKTQKLESVYKNPGKYKQEVLSNPERYHPRAKDVKDRNVMWAMVMGILSYEDIETLAELYRDVSLELDLRIKYLAVDSRLFPTSARSTGIFYAPAKLSGHRIKEKEGMREPIDFYSIKLVDTRGNTYDSQEDVPADAQIADYRIEFKDMFYNSTLYRTFIGYSGQEVGRQRGIPGVDNIGAGGRRQRQLQPMPSWGYNHFKLSYRTAYYNPYKDYKNHSDAWEAISYEKGREYQQEEKGIVDLSARSYIQQGVVFLEYYDGAIVNGKVETENGQPIPGAKVTVLDEQYTPHQVVRTDSQGRYEVKVPAGNNTIIATTGGGGEKLTKTESINIGQKAVNVTPAEAMREKVDKNMDGIWDYKKQRDITAESAKISGKIYVDVDGNEEYNAKNDTLASGKVTIQNESQGLKYTMNAEAGTYHLENIGPGKYNVKTDVKGSETLTGVSLKPGDEVTDKNILVSTSSVSGNVSFSSDVSEKEFILKLHNPKRNTTRKVVLNRDENLNYSFENVIPGDNQLTVEEEDYCFATGPRKLSVSQTANLTQNLRIVKAYTIEGQTSKNGRPLSYQSLSFQGTEGSGYSRSIKADESGHFEFSIPQGKYQVYGVYYSGDKTLAHLGVARVEADTQYDAVFRTAHKVSGRVDLREANASDISILFSRDSGSQVEFKVGESGNFVAHLPSGLYSIYGYGSDLDEGTGIYEVKRRRIDKDIQLEMDISEGKPVNGKIYRDLNHNNVYDRGEGIEATITTVVDNQEVKLNSSMNGDYELVLPSGERVLTIDRQGYKNLEKSLRPSRTSVYNASLEAEEVPVSVDYLEAGDINSVKFHAVGEGALSKVIEPQEDDGVLSTELQPGSYRVIVDRGFGPDYEMPTLLNVEVAQDMIQLYVPEIQRIQGTIEDPDGDMTSANLTFVGPQDKNISVSSTYDLYLKAGDYKLRALNEQKKLAAQYSFGLQNDMVKNLTLGEAVSVETDLLYNGQGRGGIPVHFTNSDTGYEIKTMSGQGGEISLILTEGDYTVYVNHTTSEQIKGLPREVRYYHSGDYEEKVSNPIHLSKEWLNSTLTGRVKAGGRALDDIQIEMLSSDSHSVTTDFYADGDGYFEGDIAEGKYTIYATYSKGQERYSIWKQFYMPDENKQLDIHLRDAVKIDGKVVRNIDGKFKGVDPTEIKVTRNGTTREFSTYSNGEFAFIVPKGYYEINTETEIDTEYGLATFKKERIVDLQDNRYIQIELDKIHEYGIEIMDEFPERKASQGDKLRYTATIRNTGNTIDTYNFSSKGWNITFDREEIKLVPDQEKKVSFTVEVADEAKVNHEPVKMVVKSTRSDKTAEKQIPIQIKQVHDVNVLPEVAKKSYKDGKLKYTIKVNNTGNGQDEFNLSIINRYELKNKGWQAVVQDSTGKMDSGTQKEIIVVLKAIRSNPKEGMNIRVKAVSVNDRTVSDSNMLAETTDIPEVKSDSSTLGLEGEKLALQEETFSLKTWHWVGIITLVVIVALYVMRRRRWI